LAVHNEALPTATTSAQPANGQAILLWAEGDPGTRERGGKELSTLTPYFAESGKATGAAMVICPGGGYTDLSPREGVQYAKFLAEQGIAGFVLKYRLASDGYHYPAMLEDASRAVRLIRAHAREWKLNPNKIGIMGSSAGGHLAATLMTHFDGGDKDAADAVERQSSRPDLGVLCYPVITMEGSVRQLTIWE
jgi:acetyl esterase/lipase